LQSPSGSRALLRSEETLQNTGNRFPKLEFGKQGNRETGNREQGTRKILYIEIKRRREISNEIQAVLHIVFCKW
jgi:hypothetical protein